MPRPERRTGPMQWAAEHFSPENLEKLGRLFRPGDVVFDEDVPNRYGIMCGSCLVAWEDGGESVGGGLVPYLWHVEPRVCVLPLEGLRTVEKVRAALRKAGLR